MTSKALIELQSFISGELRGTENMPVPWRRMAIVNALEQKGPAFGLLEQPAAGDSGAGERAGAVTEQLHLRKRDG